jgi:dolichol-phosphate mannosyltransferase
MSELISIVIPCYNEAESIAALDQRMVDLAETMLPYQFEFIYVDDGSVDGTATILNTIAEGDRRVKVLHLAQNRGHQIALTAGMDFAAGEVIITIDGDLQHPPELIADMIKEIESGYDVVHAQRQIRTGESWFKRLTAKFFYFFMRHFSDLQIIEDSGDYRAFTRAVKEALKGFRMPHRFLRGLFVNMGFRQCIIPYQSDARFAGHSKYSFLKMMNLALDGALGYSAAPIRFITYLSVLFWLISLAHLVTSLIDHFVLKVTVPGWTSIIVLMFFFTGLILFSIAIIGSYVGRIFVQGQDAPLYWLNDARNLDNEVIQECGGDLREVRLSQRILSNRKKRRSYQRGTKP